MGVAVFVRGRSARSRFLTVLEQAELRCVGPERCMACRPCVIVEVQVCVIFDGKLVGHRHPSVAQCSSAFSVGLSCFFFQRAAHFLNFADARTHLDREIDGEVPDVVGRKVTKHAFY